MWLRGLNIRKFQPCGIQVSLIESLRFLLLKAVIIPITKKTLGRSFNCSLSDFVCIGDRSSLTALAALAAASCISKEETVLSSVLKVKENRREYLLTHNYWTLPQQNPKYDETHYILYKQIYHNFSYWMLLTFFAQDKEGNRLVDCKTR